MASAPFTIFTTLRYDRFFLSSTVPPDAGWNAASPSPLYMLDLHRDRLLRAASHFGWQPVMSALSGDQGIRLLAAKVAEAAAEQEIEGPKRTKISFGVEGDVTVEMADIPQVTMANLFPDRLPPPGGEDDPGRQKRQRQLEYLPDRSRRIEVFVDQAGTVPTEYTHFKTSRREMYDAARARAGIVSVTAPQEVLIVSDHDGAGTSPEPAILEASRSTPYFWRGGRWVTPPVGKPGAVDGSGSDHVWGGQDGTTRRWALDTGRAVEEIVPAASVVHAEECWLSGGARGWYCGVVVRQ